MGEQKISILRNLLEVGAEILGHDVEAGAVHCLIFYMVGEGELFAIVREEASCAFQPPGLR